MRSIPGTECESRSYRQYSRASSDREMKSRVLPLLEAVLPLLEEAVLPFLEAVLPLLEEAVLPLLEAVLPLEGGLLLRLVRVSECALCVGLCFCLCCIA